MIRKLALALALWLAPLPALAALAIDSQEAANTGHASQTSPLTWSFTNTAGTLLIVGVCVNNSNLPAPTISGVTYNAVAMSAISGTTSTATAGLSSNVCTLFQLLSPATGAHTVSVTFDNTGCGGCGVDTIAGAISFTGNNTTTPTGNPGTASNTTGSSTAAAVSLTGTASGDFVVSLVATGSGVGAGSGSTTISWKDNVSTLDAGDNAALGQQTTAGGTVTAGFSVTADIWVMSAIEVFVAPASGITPTNGLELVSVGGTLNHGDGSPGGGGGALAPGFFVSTTGNDNNAGTLAAPWATVFHAQQVMRGNNCGGVPTGLCLTYVRGGTYNLGSPISFIPADSGETIQYYPPDGINSAVFDGGNTLDGMIQGSSGANNITLNGLKIQNPIALAIQVNHGSGWLIENNDIGFNHSNNSSLGYGGFAPIIDWSGVNNTVTNNYVHDCASQCIAGYAFAIGERIDGGLITKNVVLRAVQQADDGGCIYVNMHATSTLGGHVSVTNNYCRDQGGQLIGGVAGIYLDDNASNVTVTGNIIGAVPANWQGSAARRDAPCIEIFGGVTPTMEGSAPNQPQNDTIQNNVCDLGFTARMLIVGAGPSQGQTNNSFKNNIVLSNYAGATGTQDFCPGQEYCAQSPGFTVQNNAYHNYGGGAETTTGTPNDSSPQHYTPTQLGILSCPNGIYAVTGGSTVTGAPVSFPALPTSWGPTGFTIPASTNHSC